MKHYCTSIEETFKNTKSGQTGLDSDEALERLKTNGLNKLAEEKGESLFHKFFSQLKDPMIIILLAAAAISAVTSIQSHESMADVIIILFVVIVNAVLGVYQENKAEKAIEALQEMAAATSKIIRDGKQITVKSEEIVVGDIVVLEAGDSIPADGRLIESMSLQIEESALTGESVPVNKFIDILNLNNAADIPLGDRKNMIYMGSTVAYGRGKAVITDTGMDTEMGKIATALANAEAGQTPLQKNLAHLSKVLTVMVLAICAAVFVIGLIRARGFSGEVILNTFMIAVSLAVAAIPEGLAAVVTIVLSIGVTNMSERNAIIRRLTAVETLGCAQIICSDKTGTLTQNIMTVVEHFGSNEEKIALAMALCSDAELGENGKAVGEPTECALVNYAASLGIYKSDLKKSYPRIAEVPFDSVRKMMTTVHKTDNGVIQFTKGAPDEIIKRCTHYNSDGKIIPLTDELKEKIIKANYNMSTKALRVLAAATKTMDKEPEEETSEYLEHDLCFLGLTGMIDPVRPEAVEAIEVCKTAGITPIMITGDHINTAVAIAKSLGILENESQAVTGLMLDEMSDEEFNSKFMDIRVYARVQPEHKVKIVNAWRNAGYVTAMTGDGVNDAPSIKSADIGVGMGINGTDVTKNVSDMVLADDNFATIVGAVEEGRRIYSNIRKAIQFLLSSNMSEVLSIFIATLFGFTILGPVHLLWINLVTDCFPALALGMEKAEGNVMKHQPRSSDENIFSGGMGIDILYQGIAVTVLTLSAYFIGYYMENGVFEIANNSQGTTMAFMTMSMAEIFHSFNLRSRRESLFSMKIHNSYLNWAAFASLILTTAVIYIPFLSNAFGFAHITFAQYAVSLLLAVAIIPIVEIVKLIQRTIK
ncbi:MAG: cation-translocating P-type ATPase [Bacillota bacterium]|nr:cation-translocating P-type ATPase [Bacillota bacterium]